MTKIYVYQKIVINIKKTENRYNVESFLKSLRKNEIQKQN